MEDLKVKLIKKEQAVEIFTIQKLRNEGMTSEFRNI